MARTKVSELKYIRYDIEQGKQVCEQVKTAIKEAKTAQEVVDARKTLLAEYEKFATMGSLSYTRYTLNTIDEFYLAEKEYFDEITPIMQNYMAEISALMLDSPFRKEIEEKKLIPATSYPCYECARKSVSEKIIPEMQEENSIVTEYSQLMAGLTTDWRGEQKTISYIRGFLEDNDRAVRKSACEAIDRALSSKSAELDDIYDRLVKVRTKMAKKMGYENYIEMGYYLMNRIDYNRDMVETFRNNVKNDLVPVVTALKKSIAKELGIEDLRFYDDGIIAGDVPRPFLNEQEILQAGKEMYRDLSSETGDFMDSMLEAEAFDVTARENKWGGGYCTSFDSYRQPFILANFNGSSADIDTITHEFGHAFAMNFAYTYGDEETSVGSMETAETHSMSMEFFTWKYVEKFFKDGNAYRYKHLVDSFCFIPYGVIVDEFQHIMYANPDMTSAERDQAYLDLEKKYRPYISYEGLPYLSKGTRWQYQMHIYESPFYYIDYCLAQVVALEFLVESRKDYDNAFARYVEHCKRGGNYGFNTLVKMAGLKSPFEDGALKEIANCVAEIAKELKK